jgi:hypothetical protein
VIRWLALMDNRPLSGGCLPQLTRQFRCPPFGACGRCAIVRVAGTCTAAD